ncbi:sulfite exporter TauE/SafE family protein [Aurantimonas sp. VKM B-3413]|uniref:sulfite exporter TauE/SafE family protein n=1 Tax=Aurantimonas sp. VKM B-3413 TaxID=2779401 RepID=UPI001E50C14E|nr:sulfite exporter TauE/SafE family protein [Aurantimonas sp. VKM B-3413]
MTLAEILVVAACLAAGGTLKGATGAGAPVLAVPAMAAIFDVKFAVVVMVVPNLLTNLWQGWRFREFRPRGAFVWSFAIAGAIGVTFGTAILAALPQEVLSLVVACSVLGYVAFRLARPDWRIPFALGKVLSVPAGVLAGMLQGASGISAPVSISFLNALALERSAFIATISIFFAGMSATQIPALATLGILTAHSLLFSLAALVPLLAFMPVGSKLAERLPPRIFDRVILVLLAGLAAKLFYDALV